MGPKVTFGQKLSGVLLMFDVSRTLCVAAVSVCLAILPASGVSAQSADIEGVISSVSTDDLTLKLKDGTVLTVPSEFNFEGLENGVKVYVFYTQEGDQKVVNDLEVLN